jgi:CheY-like chemotaxis protein
MDEDTRRRCLEPFFTTKGERGTGLGLPMVFGTAQRHGAELRIESTLGAGTTIRIEFPLAVATGPDAVADHALPRRVARLRLLVIDDDPVLLRALGEALETNGHQVATAGAGQAGIDAFRVAEEGAEPFDAVITDLGMPHVDGRRVAAAVKERAPATPVLLLTGWGQRMAKDGDTPDHVDRVLSKPPKVRDILAALDQVLRPPVAPTNP